MKRRGIYNIKSMEPRRKELRRNLTPAEALLWKQLQCSRLDGKKFRRQQSISRYVVDFLCPECRVIVELDGEPHSDVIRQRYDETRTKHLEGLGYRVVRFENRLVFRKPGLRFGKHQRSVTGK